MLLRAPMTKETAPRVARDRLVDRMDHSIDAVADLTPLPALQGDRAALDLDDGDADARPGDDQAGLAVLSAVAEAQVAEQDSVVGQLLLQRLDQVLFGRRPEPRIVREPARGHRHTSCTCITTPRAPVSAGGA